MLLFRPVGVKELELVANSNYRAFPPRLFWQPIFYPVLTFDYARSIAEDWNTKDSNSGFAGFVTRFEIEDSYIAKFDVHEVGGKSAKELWVPSEELDEFNKHIVERIVVAASYYGDQFAGSVDTETHLPTHIPGKVEA